MWTAHLFLGISVVWLWFQINKRPGWGKVLLLFLGCQILSAGLHWTQSKMIEQCYPDPPVKTSTPSKVIL